MIQLLNIVATCQPDVEVFKWETMELFLVNSLFIPGFGCFFVRILYLFLKEPLKGIM